MVQEGGFQVSDKKSEKRANFDNAKFIKCKNFFFDLECSFDEMIKTAGGNCLNVFTR